MLLGMRVLSRLEPESASVGLSGESCTISFAFKRLSAMGQIGCQESVVEVTKSRIWRSIQPLHTHRDLSVEEQRWDTSGDESRILRRGLPVSVQSRDYSTQMRGYMQLLGCLGA